MNEMPIRSLANLALSATTVAYDPAVLEGLVCNHWRRNLLPVPLALHAKNHNQASLTATRN